MASLNRDQVKYIVVSGGVCSSLGKGVIASSIGSVLKAYGLRVTAIKIDPYFNVDAGLMSPFEHGEVFVLDDGGEVDLDLGNYERNMDLHLNRDNNITSGKVYHEVYMKERRGEYLGKTVQTVPHVTGLIVQWIQRVASVPTDGSDIKPQICVIELGGTVGDIESMVFLEALRTLRWEVGSENYCQVHCSLVPSSAESGQKTKPTQHTVRALCGPGGLMPDIIACRCSEPILERTREKISQQCGVPSQAILSVHNVDNLHKVPLLLNQQNIMVLLSSVLRLDRINKSISPENRALTKVHSMKEWEGLVSQAESHTENLYIAIVGKYTEKDVTGVDNSGDTYHSVLKALEHACLEVGRRLKVLWVDSSSLENPAKPAYQESVAKLEKADGILVPGGFGDRGIEGKMRGIRFAREKKVPYLGVCLGMQLAVIEFARSICGIERATSEEFAKSPEDIHVLRYMPEVSREFMGGTMVLGSRKVVLKEGSLCSDLYGGATEVTDRHRHRYEVNDTMNELLTSKGVRFTGQNPTGERMEVMELSEDLKHPFWLGVQFHPEFKSRPGSASPPFLGFVAAAVGQECLKQVRAKNKENGPAFHYLPQEEAETEVPEEEEDKDSKPSPMQARPMGEIQRTNPTSYISSPTRSGLGSESD